MRQPVPPTPAACLLLLVLLLAGPIATAQVMNLHMGEHTARMDFQAVDSLRFHVDEPQPASLVLSWSRHGAPAGGTLVSFPFGALVLDQFGRPMTDGTDVSFTSQPDITGFTAAQTGNEGPNEVVRPGVAYSTMSYQSISSGQTVSIDATVQGPAGPVTATLDDLALPVLDPEIQLSTDLQNFFYQDMETVAVFEATAYVEDANSIAQDGILVRFQAQTGIFLHQPDDPMSEMDIEMVTGDTDPETGYPDIGTGEARRYLAVPFDMGFLDPSMLEVSVELHGMLPGYPEQDPSNVTVELRHSVTGEE